MELETPDPSVDFSDLDTQPLLPPAQAHEPESSQEVEILGEVGSEVDSTATTAPPSEAEASPSTSQNVPAHEAPQPKRSGGNVLAAKRNSMMAMATIKDDPLLKRCSGKGQLLNEGTLVWAQDQGSVFWPACIVPDPPPDSDAEETDNDPNGAELAFVMFIEPKFRLGLVKWTNVIEVDTDSFDVQKSLMNDLNRLESRRKYKRAKKGPDSGPFERSCSLLTDLIKVPPSLRQATMQDMFAEFTADRLRRTKETKEANRTSGASRTKVETPTTPVEPPKRKLSNLRERPPVAKKWTYPSTSQISPRVSLDGEESQEVVSSGSVAKRPKPGKFSRPRSLEGEALRAWTLEKFERLDKAMKFESLPHFRCAKCKEELEDESQMAFCHDYPFHKTCLIQIAIMTKEEDGITSLSLKCKDCADEVCFICKADSGGKDGLAVVKCSAAKCELRFHRDCLVFNWPQGDVIGSSGQVMCPLHFCHGCKAEHFHGYNVRDYKVSTAKAIRCLYCLATYHKPSCIPAGSGNTIMKNQFMICPRHAAETAPPRKTKAKRLGCFCCQIKLKPTDSTVNCSLCPLTFHSSCVHGEFHLKAGVTLEALKKWFKCESCLWGMYPRYGSMVWFQQPGSSYWPAMILYPKEGILRGAEAPAQFSVGYCGYPIQYYDNGRLEDSLQFEIGRKEFLKKLNLYSSDKVLEAANEAFHLHKLSEANRTSILPNPEPVYRKIDKNLYRVDVTVSMVNNNVKNKNNARRSGGRRKPLNDGEHCECGRGKDKEARCCTADSGCFNRDAAVECSANNCSAEDRCENRMFSQKQHKEHLLEPFVVPATKGWGLKAKADFAEGTFLLEYIGEIISKEEVMWRVERKADDDALYFLELDALNFIDAEYYGNYARLINHSCAPNCSIVKYWGSQGKPVIAIFAKRKIAAEEELTFDYNYGPKSTFAFQCHCRAPKCKGVIGSRRGNEENLMPNGGSIEDEASRWEDDCATCGSPGELLMCDFEGCVKAHHHQCLNLTSTPKGLWYCPLHPEQPSVKGPDKGASESRKLRLKGPPSKKRRLSRRV